MTSSEEGTPTAQEGISRVGLWAVGGLSAIGAAVLGGYVGARLAVDGYLIPADAWAWNWEAIWAGVTTFATVGALVAAGIAARHAARVYGIEQQREERAIEESRLSRAARERAEEDARRLQLEKERAQANLIDAWETFERGLPEVVIENNSLAPVRTVAVRWYPKRDPMLPEVGLAHLRIVPPGRTYVARPEPVGDRTDRDIPFSLHFTDSAGLFWVRDQSGWLTFIATGSPAGRIHPGAEHFNYNDRDPEWD